MNSSKSTIAIFDFDKTLITKDSFLIFVFLEARNLFGKLFIVILTLLCRAGFICNVRYKILLIERFWMKQTIKECDQLKADLLDVLTGILNAQTQEALLMQVQAGDEVAIMSAAPEFYLVPFVHIISSNVRVFGSRVTETTDEIALINFFHVKKKEVAKGLIEQSPSNRNVVVYTNHIEDLSLLRLATSAVLVHPRRALSKAIGEQNIPFETFR